MTAWRKSSYSGTGAQSDCVEVAQLPDALGVRDSKNPEGGAYAIPLDAARDLVDQIKRGEYDGR